MMVQNHDTTLLQQYGLPPRLPATRECYRIEIPAAALDEQCRQIEQVLLFALDTLGAHHLDVRVISSERGGDA